MFGIFLLFTTYTIRALFAHIIVLHLVKIIMVENDREISGYQIDSITRDIIIEALIY